jgi:hypothetical protein
MKLALQVLFLLLHPIMIRMKMTKKIPNKFWTTIAIKLLLAPILKWIRTIRLIILAVPVIVRNLHHWMILGLEVRPLPNITKE